LYISKNKSNNLRTQLNMQKAVQLLIVLIYFSQITLAQKNQNVKTYSIGDYQLEINIPKLWEPMSEQKKTAVVNEMELQRTIQDSVDQIPMAPFIVLEKDVVCSFLGEYAIIDSTQKIQVQAQLDKLLETTCNFLKSSYPDITLEASETKLRLGTMSYRVFNIEAEMSNDISFISKYYCTFLENTVIGFMVSTIGYENQKEILNSIKDATFRQMSDKKVANLTPQADIASLDQNSTIHSNDKGKRKSFKFNGQNLSFVSKVPYRKTRKKEYDKDKNTKDKGVYSHTVFYYKGLLGKYFKCNAHVFMPADTAIDANYLMHLYEQQLAEPSFQPEIPSKYERQDLNINGRNFCLGILAFESDLMTIYSYTYYTKVETIIYEITILTFTKGDIALLTETMLSMIIEPSHRN
jgi:hypothetical protein